MLLNADDSCLLVVDKLALTRTRAAGIHIISKEMALFEWARQAGTEIFKQLSRGFCVSDF